MNKKELREHIIDQDKEIYDLIAKVIELIVIIGWDDDDTHTFSDGDRWARFDPDYESAQARAKESTNEQ